MSRGGRASGKKRGDNALTFSLESMGLSRGESLPPPTLHPPALYPQIDLKSAPLRNSEVDNYLLTLKQEFRQSLMTSKYYINPPKAKPKIERYSDKYENIANKNVLNGSDLEFDWRLFPPELCLEKKRRITKKLKVRILKDIDKKLENLSERENEDETDEEKSNHELEENATDDEKAEELEDVEEGTDYTFSYFDNGENYLEDSDDNMDEGPTY